LNQEFFDQYNAILNKTALASQSKDINTINSLSHSMKALFPRLTSTIQHEKPQWRFKYFIIPVTMGWPFHREARAFAANLIRELDETYKRSLEFVSVSKDSIVANLQSEASVASSSRASIERQMATETKSCEESEKNVTSSIQKLTVPEAELLEAKEFMEDDMLDRCLRCLVKWSEDASASQVENYINSLELLTTKELAETTLADMLKIVAEEDEKTSEAFKVTAFNLSQLLEILLLNPLLKSAKHNNTFDQINLLSTLLQVVMNAKSEDFSYSKNKFDRLCKLTFDRKNARTELRAGYSSHGFLSFTSLSICVPDSKSHPQLRNVNG
jgi:hypothetical protein